MGMSEFYVAGERYPEAAMAVVNLSRIGWGQGVTWLDALILFP
jgi:hypothetical protein